MDSLSFLYPLILIFTLALLLNSFFKAALKLRNGHSITSSLIISPMLLSLILFYLFLFFPNQNKITYVSFFLLAIIPLFLFKSKQISRDISWLREPIKKAVRHRRGIFSNILIGLLGFVFLLCGLRIFFWPINWDDQIYYIEQAYAIGQERTLETFQNWGVFDNGILRHQMLPAIRPGLPLLYSFSTLFSTRLSDSVLFSQFMTFYYMVILVGILIYLASRINRKNVVENTLITLLLIFTTYLFINLTVLGFKELLIICLLFLGLYTTSLADFRGGKNMLVYLGAVFGLMTYLNYSGSLLTCIFLLMLFFKLRSNFFGAIRKIVFVWLVVLLMGGFEFLYSINMALGGGFIKASLRDQIEYASVTINNFVSTNKKTYPFLPLDISGISTNNTGVDEYKSYGIDSPIAVYTRGKLQGYFQFQYFGLLFVIFLLTVMSRFKYIWQESLSKWILIFLGLYYIFFLDIFKISSHQFSVVLTVSHKYTALLVPFVSLIIGSQWQWIKRIFSRLNLWNILTICGLIFMSGIFIVGNNYPNILKLVMKIVPPHNSDQYYINVLKTANSWMIALSASVMIFIIFGRIIFGKRLKIWWQKNGLSSVLIFVMIFYLPFLFFFNSNFGLMDTLTYSLSSAEVKLTKIKGWQGLYLMVNYLNRLPTGSNVLFVNSNVNQLEIHLTAPSANMFSMRTKKEDFTTDFMNGGYLNIDYIVVPPTLADQIAGAPLFKTDQYSLYAINFSDEFHTDLFP